MKTSAMKEGKKGFTLLELLVVISIIGILAALLLANLVSTRERARDATRQSDMKQYQTTLGQYAADNSGLYPLHDTAGGVVICATSSLWQDDMGLPTCIDDPQEPTERYRYISNDTRTEYAVWAKLENSTGLWVLCSNGLVDETSTVPGSGGSVCPL